MILITIRVGIYSLNYAITENINYIIICMGRPWEINHIDNVYLYDYQGRVRPAGRPCYYNIKF